MDYEKNNLPRFLKEVIANNNKNYSKNSNIEAFSESSNNLKLNISSAYIQSKYEPIFDGFNSQIAFNEFKSNHLIVNSKSTPCLYSNKKLQNTPDFHKINQKSIIQTNLLALLSNNQPKFKGKLPILVQNPYNKEIIPPCNSLIK